MTQTEFDELADKLCAKLDPYSESDFVWGLLVGLNKAGVKIE